MTTLHRIALTGLTAAALLVTVAAPEAGAQEDRAKARSQSERPQRVQIAPQPPAGHVPGPGGITTQAPPVGTPTLAQLGSSSAYVPMKHGTVAPLVHDHVLAIQNGNLNMKFKAGMTCPAGSTVIFYRAKPAGVNATTFINSDTGAVGYSANVTLKPFPKSELESTCQDVFGGPWPEGNPHNNATQTVKKTISKKIEVWGQCSGWVNKTKRTYTALLTLTCHDRSWPIPPVG